MTGQFLRCLCCLGIILFGPVMAAPAQSLLPPGTPLTDPELDALVAPVALYPDLLLAQVVEASKDPSALVAAGDLVTKPGDNVKPPAGWPGAVKALMHIPSALQMMDESLPWTTRLGNAVKRSHPHVIEAVQRVRVKALDAGNLVSDDKQKVEQIGGVVKIELADPAVLYVPKYDPSQMFDKHGPDSEPWLTYGPPITIPGFKNVADGLASVEYVHTEAQYHHHYYGEPAEETTRTRVVTTRGIRLRPWRGWRYDPFDHDHHGHHHHH